MNSLKTLLLSSTAAAISITAPLIAIADGAVTSAQTAFWQAPALTSFDFQVADGSDELKKACDDLEALKVNNAELPDSYRKKNFDAERKLGLKSQFPNRSFAVSLKTNVNPNGDLLTDESRQALKPAPSEDGDLEQQAPVAQIADFSSASEYSVQPVAGMPESSLVQTSQQLGLAALPLKMEAKQGSVALVVEGKDTACDLIAGRVQVTAKLKSSTRIDTRERARMTDFYLKVADISRAVVGKYKKPSQRAAALGFRLGGMIAATPKMNVDQAEAVLIKTVDKLFDPASMTYNALWTDSVKGKTLIVENQSAPFVVTTTFRRSL